LADEEERVEDACAPFTTDKEIKCHRRIYTQNVEAPERRQGRQRNMWLNHRRKDAGEQNNSSAVIGFPSFLDYDDPKEFDRSEGRCQGLETTEGTRMP
jgi:hypothetical protein